MANTREIQSRMKSIQDTMKITNAMYMISSTKLRKAKKNLEETGHPAESRHPAHPPDRLSGIPAGSSDDTTDLPDTKAAPLFCEALHAALHLTRHTGEPQIPFPLPAKAPWVSGRSDP